MSIDQIMSVVKEEDFDVTLTGGDPLYNPHIVIELSDAVHAIRHNIWLYTGFTWEEIMNDHLLFDAVSHVDVVVDSPFILELKDKDLPFRGSKNQRIVDTQRSIKTGKIQLWEKE